MQQDKFLKKIAIGIIMPGFKSAGKPKRLHYLFLFLFLLL